MRKFKFRGKVDYVHPEDGNEWIYGNLRMISGEPYITSFDNGQDYPVVRESVGEWSGLKDKNGKDIYEGDIVKIFIPFLPEDYFCLVKYIDGCFDIYNPKWGRDYLKCHTCNHAVEVIGNKFENPELLEDVK